MYRYKLRSSATSRSLPKSVPRYRHSWAGAALSLLQSSGVAPPASHNPPNSFTGALGYGDNYNGVFDGTYGMAMNTTLRHKIVGQKNPAMWGFRNGCQRRRPSAYQDVSRTDLMLCRSLPILLSKWTTRDIQRRVGCRPVLACRVLVPIRALQVGLEI
jgi:hypothetical protein